MSTENTLTYIFVTKKWKYAFQKLQADVCILKWRWLMIGPSAQPWYVVIYNDILAQKLRTHCVIVT